MDKDQIAVEFLRIYFNSHPNKIPEDEEKAFEMIQKLHSKIKNKLLSDLKNKSERFVDKYFDNKDDKYL